ncbi:MAG: Ig-like domain-containing protein [Rhodospirillales bacterium]
MTGTVFLEESEISVGEANGIVYVPVVRTGDLSGSAVVNYGVTGNSATEGVDFVAGNGSVTMAAGQDRILVPVQILNDGLSEPTETIAFSIISVDSGSTLLFPRTATVAILDDENPVVDPPAPPLSSPYAVTQQTLITGLENPMRLEFSPHDPSIVFIPQKDGVLRVFDLDTGTYLPNFVNLSAEVNHAADRGLMDIAFHPDFANNPYLYAFYVVDPPDTAGRTGNAGPDGDGNRFAWVVRWTLDPATGYTTPLPGSKTILVGGAGDSLSDISGGGTVNSTDNISQAESGYNAQTGVYTDNYIKVDSLSHAGGALAFGPDGMLYISVGDGTSYNTADPRSHSVQQIDSLSGKILRVDPITGLGLADNPFVQPGDDLSSNHAKVYQLGLRNSYSMGFDSDGRLYMTNTGWNTWEEIESGPPGANFGWPYYEGGDNGVLEKTPSYQNLSTAPAFYAAVANGSIDITPAYRAFNHSEGAPGYEVQAIVGGDVVYSGSRYPAEFLNDYFFSDIVDGEVYVIDVNDRREVRFLYSSNDGPVHFTQGPDGYVYYANLFSGEVGRLLIADIDELDLVARGNAFYNPDDDVYTLTTAAGSHQAGMVSSTDRIDVREDFTIAFDAYLGASDSGADGIAFVVHNDPLGYNVVGVDGSGLGTMLIKNGIGIEFDTYNNLPIDWVSGVADIAADHTGFFDTDSKTGTTPVALANLEDNQWHSVVVSWDASAQTLSYTLDGVSMGSLTTDLVTTFLGGSSFAYFGVGGGTGGLANLQMVKLTSIAATYENETPGNGAPVAIADSASTATNTPVSINVLANDSDPNLDPLSIISVANPAHGTATINDNGTPANGADDFIVYTPASGYAGPDSFTYTISDGTASTVGSVSVTVNAVPPPNTPPVANPDTASTAAGTPVTVSVLANDSDANADPITIIAVSAPAHGTAVINNNGTPANPADDTIVYTPAAGYSGPDGFTYTISDGKASTVGSVGVTVTAPPPATLSLKANGSTTFDSGTGVYTLTSSTGQAGTVMTTARVDVRQNFSLAFDLNFGDRDWAADGMAFVIHNAAAGANAVGGGGSGLGIAGLANGLAIEFDTYNSPAGNRTIGVADIAADHTGFLDTDSLTGTTPVALANIEDGLWHAVSVNWNAATKVLSYTFDGVSMGSLATDMMSQYLGNSEFAYLGFGAGTGGLDNVQKLRVHNISATVQGQAPNTPPVANADSATTAAGAPVTVNVLANDSDADANPITIVAVSAPAHGTATINNNGTPANPADDTVVYTPAAGYSGPDGFTYTISDGTATTVGSVGVTVTPPPNTPPVANTDTAATVAGTPVSVNVLANDSDANGDPLTIVGVTTPGHGTAAINNNGTAANPADDFIVYTPAAGYSGPDGFSYTISDGKASTVGAVNVTVNAVPPPNSPPVANNDSATTAAGTPVSVNVLGNDSDPNNDPLTIVGVTAPGHGTATINNNGTAANPADDFIVYTPAAGYSGPDSFSYTISDGAAQRAATVSVTVTPPPAVTLVAHGSATFNAATDTYTLTSTTGQSGGVTTSARVDVREDFSASFKLNFGDADWAADGMAFVIHNDPAGATVNGGAGSGLGIAGIRNGLAIEFDTYNSPAGNRTIGVADIAADHTGFLDPDALTGTTPVALPNIEDGLWHTVVVNWDSALKVLSYTFDGVSRGSLATDMMSSYLGNSEFAYLGFGAGTGGLANIQQLQVLAIDATFV